MAAVPDPALAPFDEAVRTEKVNDLRPLWYAARDAGMPPDLLAALGVVCAARLAQLVAQDAQARALLEWEVGATPVGAHDTELPAYLGAVTS